MAKMAETGSGSGPKPAVYRYSYGSNNEVHFYCMQIVYCPHQTKCH